MSEKVWIGLVHAKPVDKNAAFKLFQHYELGVGGEKESRYWLEKSAKSGHVLAQEILAFKTKRENL